MAGFARHLGAALVVIAMIAAQIMPAWSGCDSHRHSAASASAAVSGHYAASNIVQVIDSSFDESSSSSQSRPGSQDKCFGNCGCACGLSGALVLASASVIDAPLGVVRNTEFASADLPLGSGPDGPRRPPRTIA